MPVYEYDCAECGSFAALRPMAEFADPHPCPDCGDEAPRVMLTAPMLAGMDAGRKKAFETNERSAHAPKSTRSHGANCSCCSGGKISRRTRVGADGSKSFPSARPWMISH